MKKKHCCELMTYNVNYVCKQHEDPFDCPDNLVFYLAKFDQYGIIIHDGRSSFIEIMYCPWCGTKLPMSKRELWLDTLEKLGYDEPFEQDIPEEFESDKWYNK
ncbi:DUF6980 family protein [Gottfriedia acidiceleris]|uniref:DUF6980 family protein n=1 Tax=Gottfriedia acidiceleris TaxID=371036 RepID=UPI00101CCE6C|nr:hypothetical protein [Gottfriedia acidiceleris]